MRITCHNPETGLPEERDIDPNTHTNVVKKDGKRWWLTEAGKKEVEAEQIAIQRDLDNRPMHEKISAEDARKIIDRGLLPHLTAKEQQEVKELAAKMDAELIRRAKEGI